MMTERLDILPTLIVEKLKLRLEHLEKIFSREASDIQTLEIHMSDIKKHSDVCNVVVNDIIHKQMEDEIKKKLADEKRMHTEPSSTRGKSIGKQDEKKGMTKTKTAAVIKTVHKEDAKGMTKAKSTLHLSPEEIKARPKTPKAADKTMTKSSTKADLHTPKKKPELTTSQSVKQLNDKAANDDKKVMKRNPTAKPNADKGGNTKVATLTKSNTKGDLIKKGDKGTKNVANGHLATPNGVAVASNPETPVSSTIIQHETVTEPLKTEEVSVASNIITNETTNLDPNGRHPARYDNISGLIGVMATNTDVILTKDETLVINERTSIAQPKLDYNEILDDRWVNFAKYYNLRDHINNILINKTFGKLSLTSIIQEIQKEIVENEVKIKALREKCTMDELNKPIPQFVLSRGATKAIELLNEAMYSKIFSDGNHPKDDVLLPYRVLFIFGGIPLGKIKDNHEFWSKTCEYMCQKSQGKMGSMIHSMLQNSAFTDEIIDDVAKIIGTNISKMTPNYFSKLCATTGLVIFMIKDVLEYSGVVQEKKTPLARIHKTLLHNFEVFQQHLERLKGVQTKIFTS